jgi:serine/threonine-protein kinase HipA
VSDTIDQLGLWYDGSPVADVSRTASDLTSLRLTYRSTWIERPAAFPISIRFPLRSEPCEGPEVHAWLMNLLPEGEDLDLIGQHLGVSDLDVLGLVDQLGGDLPGALTAQRPDIALTSAAPRVHVWDEAGLAEDVRRLPRRPLLAGDEGVHMSLAGQQSKLAVVRLGDGRLGLPLDGYPSTHILKPASRHLYGSVENEAFCMRLAAACGLPVAEVEVGRAEDRDYLLVRRYDRKVEGDRVERLHQEDLCQALGMPPYLKYEWNARVRLSGPSTADLFQAVSIGPRTLPNRLALLDMIIFNVLCCNVDAHAKNYSIIHRGQVPEMAPLYDVMCGTIYEGITPNLAQKIADQQRGDHIHGRHWDRMAEEIRMSAPQVRRRLQSLANKALASISTVSEEALASGPNPMVSGVAHAIESRCRRILTNLKD